ncbi:hypothetical protein [Actomonas aquatica]|uniref:Peptidase M50 domain-containing protein n=1 Tax=Actomonas aquatica TaxID=2866162 RepID=A0ABZ1C3Q9_9BACT|nr:hypothetical protein [Opitutus sp. WL0086]WRQ86000.1 hypothetical protein K1X11_014395 [Opitutus sp. WL0086]
MATEPSPFPEVVLRHPPHRPEPAPAASHWGRTLVAMAVGAAVGYGTIAYLANGLAPLPGWGPKLLLIACIPLLIWLATGLHELGHLLAGRLNGERLFLFTVGPFKILRTPNGLRAGMDRSLNLFEGTTVCLPKDPGKLNLRGFARVVAGGPAASLLGAVGGGLLSRGMEPVAAIHSSFLHNSMVLFSVISALQFLATIWPAKVSGFSTDGKRLLELRRKGPAGEKEAAMLSVTALTLAGTRPRDVPDELMQRVRERVGKASADRTGHYMTYLSAADCGNWHEAQAQLDAAVDDTTPLPDFFEDGLRCEYAWLLATRTGEATTAKAWLDTAGALELDPPTRYRAEAAVALASGDYARAEALAAAGLAALPQTLGCTRDPFSEDTLQALLDSARVKGERTEP